MGQLEIQTHWDRIVARSTRLFIEAEDQLVRANGDGDGPAVQIAAYEALRAGMSAAIFLYHFHEVALERKAVNPQPASLQAMRTMIEGATRSASGDPRPDDHRILGGLANAVKHAELRDPAIIEVPKTGVVVRISHGKPAVFDEGRPDGTPQVTVVSHLGDRSLSALLQNVSFGWRDILGL